MKSAYLHICRLQIQFYTNKLSFTWNFTNLTRFQTSGRWDANFRTSRFNLSFILFIFLFFFFAPFSINLLSFAVSSLHCVSFRMYVSYIFSLFILHRKSYSLCIYFIYFIMLLSHTQTPLFRLMFTMCSIIFDSKIPRFCYFFFFNYHSPYNRRSELHGKLIDGGRWSDLTGSYKSGVCVNFVRRLIS